MMSTEARPWLTRRRFWTSLLVGLCLVAVVFAVIFKVMYLDDVPLRISPETTVLTGPLTADGRVDYIAATEPRQYPPEMVTDDNGFRLIVQRLGPSAPQLSELRRQTCEKLRLDPGIPPMLAYEPPYVYLMRYCEAEDAAGNLPANMNANQFETQLHFKLEEPWTLEEFPMMADWLTENEAALDLVTEAVRKPVFCIPWVRVANANRFYPVPSDEISRIRDFARGFQARARFRMGRGDVDGALDDIISCMRMGRQLENGDFFIDSLVGMGTQALAFAIGAGSSLEHQPTEAQWRRLLDELNQLPERRDASNLVEMERLMLLDSIQSISRGDWSLLNESRLKPLLNRDYGIDWNVVIQRANERYGELQGGDTFGPADPDTLKGHMSRDRRSYLLGDYLTSAIHFDQYEAARRRTICSENMLRIVLAMLIYERRHGTLPPAYSVDEQGRPLHSWRVLLLPWLGYDELAAKIRLDEPWDSPHNQQFHTADVPIYQCPSAAHGAGMTNYSVVEGPTCAFGGGEGKLLDSFGPRSAHLVLIVERTDAVNWMDPASELSFADACLGINRPGASGMGSEHLAGVHIGQRSGRVTFISENIDFNHIPQLLEGTIDEPY